VAAECDQAASSEQASALDLILAGIATCPTNSKYNPSAFPTFMEWNKVKVAVDPSVDRPRPKAPELVSVNHMPWYPIQPICVKKRLDHWEHRDLEKLVERPFSFLSGPRPRSNDGQDTFDVHHTLWLLYALLTGDHPSREEEIMLRLHGLPAKYIPFAVHQLVTGKDSWSEYNPFGISERSFLRLLCDLQWLAHTSPAALFPSNTSNQFRATMEYHCCDAMYRAMGNRHFLYTGFIPEVVHAGMDWISSEDAHPEVVLPSIRELMARRAAERGDGNLWAKEFHYPLQDLFVPANFPSSNHAFTVWAIKNGTHLMAAEWGKGYQHRYKVALLEYGVPVENSIPYDSEGEDPCPTVNACAAPQGLIQDPPASWTDESTICSSYKPHSWEEFEASKAVFASCSTQVQEHLLTRCWRWNSALSLSPEAFETPESVIITWPGGEHSFSPAMAIIFGVHASRWTKHAQLIDGVPTEFRKLTLEEGACFGPNPPIPTPLPTLEDLARGRKPAGAFVLAVDSQVTDPMSAFAVSVLPVASRETMPTLHQVSTDWSFDTATLFAPDDFYHPKLRITTWEQGKVVRRMEGDHGKNASTMSKWVQRRWNPDRSNRCPHCGHQRSCAG